MLSIVVRRFTVKYDIQFKNEMKIMYKVNAGALNVGSVL